MYDFGNEVMRRNQTYSFVDRKFVLTFAMGAGPVLGLLLSEMFPSRARAKAMSVCMAVHWKNVFETKGKSLQDVEIALLPPV
ncbi:hypothetical protein GOBAR_AA36353 [Gossypium barbadense]|uniref:Major facilitator superfamily (MFS) profile domain-containing protein n=1 Tax=Gossypium barbadense TaxID=3634 RepID=A0A2P5VZV1_GOSBA|nr:hypothetical protein GOBAR_AA36353 [Gossypium barbadense]